MNPTVARVVLPLLLITGCVDPVDTAPPIVPCDKCDSPTTPTCEAVRTAGPHGVLDEYLLASDGTAWLTTHDRDSDLTTLWGNAGDGWAAVPFDVACRRGALALDHDDRPHVACGVPSTPEQETEVWLVTVGETGGIGRRVIGVSPGLPGTTGGLPAALAFDASGLPALLWQQTIRGKIWAETGAYSLSRPGGSGWRTDRVAPYTENGYDWNTVARLIVRDERIYMSYRRGAGSSIRLERIDGGRAQSVVEIHPYTLGARDFGLDYEVLADPENPDAWHVAFSDPSTFYDDLDEPGYIAYHHVVGDDPGERVFIDGPEPLGEAPAGLSGITMTLDPSTTPVVSYDGDRARSLRVSRRDGDGWKLVDIVRDTQVGTSIVRSDAAGRLHAAYMDLDTSSIVLSDERCSP